MPQHHTGQTRKVGFWLGLGIIVAPYIFAWLTLREGYSKTARRIAIGWAAFFIGMYAIAGISYLAMSPQERAKLDQERAEKDQLTQEEKIKDKLKSDLKGAQKKSIISAEVRVMDNLKDPDSAKFRDVKTGWLINSNPDAYEAVVCGFVNSKNSFGAYNGFSGFMVMQDKVLFQAQGESIFAKLWDHVCGETGSRDDFFSFVTVWGQPNSQTSTENNRPRPLIVSKFVVYKTDTIELRASFIPDVFVGDKPPYHAWKLLGFQNNKTNEVIKAEEALKILRAYRSKTATTAH